MEKDSLLTIADEILSEDKEILDEIIEEDIKPIIAYQKEQADKTFEKNYKALRELEEEAR